MQEVHGVTGFGEASAPPKSPPSPLPLLRARSPLPGGMPKARGDAHWVCTMSKAKRFKQVVLPADRMFKRGITRDRSNGPNVLALFTGPLWTNFASSGPSRTPGLHGVGCVRARAARPRCASPSLPVFMTLERDWGNEVLTEVVSVLRGLDGER